VKWEPALFGAGKGGSETLSLTGSVLTACPGRSLGSPGGLGEGGSGRL